MSSPVPRTIATNGRSPPKFTRVVAFSGSSDRAIASSVARTGSALPKPSSSGPQAARPQTAPVPRPRAPRARRRVIVRSDGVAASPDAAAEAGREEAGEAEL